jgi:hypothetical protein
MTAPAASQAVPPKIRNAAQPSLAVFTGVVLGMAIVGAGAVLFFFNPSTNGFYPVCQFHKATGLNCPGCGATRALYALLHGNFPRALKDNALFIFSLAALAARGAWLAARYFLHKSTGQFLPPAILWGFFAIALVFTVARNLPGFECLSP